MNPYPDLAILITAGPTRDSRSESGGKLGSTSLKKVRKTPRRSRLHSHRGPEGRKGISAIASVLLVGVLVIVGVASLAVYLIPNSGSRSTVDGVVGTSTTTTTATITSFYTSDATSIVYQTVYTTSSTGTIFTSTSTATTLKTSTVQTTVATTTTVTVTNATTTTFTQLTTVTQVATTTPTVTVTVST